jgi:hypothetical protein
VGEGGKGERNEQGENNAAGHRGREESAQGTSRVPTKKRDPGREGNHVWPAGPDPWGYGDEGVERRRASLRFVWSFCDLNASPGASRVISRPPSLESI